mgnify:FL=1
MKKIILDTNFLMIPLQFRVDIFSELERICHFNYKLCIFEQSVDELSNIAEKQKGKSRNAAQFALKLIRLKDIGVLKAEGRSVDIMLLKNADKDTVIATQDRLLKKKLLEKGVSVIILRQKKYLQLIEKLYK